MPDIQVPQKGSFGQLSTDDGITFSIEKTMDGDWEKGSQPCYINEENGFPVGDNGPLDGVACYGSKVKYKATYSIEPSDTERTFTFQQKSWWKTLDGYENRRKINTENNNYVVNDDLFKSFCSDGSIPGAKMELQGNVGYNANYVCKVTIPPTKQSAAGTFDFEELTYPTHWSNGKFPANHWNNTTFVLAQGENVQELHAPKTYVVAINDLDPAIAGYEGEKAKQEIGYLNGKRGVFLDYALFFIKESKLKNNYKDYYSDVTVKISGVPDGFTIVPKMPEDQTCVSASGDTVRVQCVGDFVKGGSKHIGYPYESNATVSSNYFPYYIEHNEFTAFRVFVPIDVLEEHPEFTPVAQIVEDNSGLHEGSIYDGMFLKNKREPGYKLDQNSRTSNWDIVASDAPGYNRWHYENSWNNDWAVKPYSFEVGAGLVKKRIYHDSIPGSEQHMDVNRQTGDPINSYDSEWYQRRENSPFTKLWSFTQVQKQLTEGVPTFYDIIDSDGKFDTSRKPIVLWRESPEGDLSEVPHRVEYAHLDLSSPDFENGKVTDLERGIDLEKNMNARAKAVMDPSVQWSTQASEDSNVVRVIFDESQDWFSSRSTVGFIGIPTVGREFDYYDFTNKNKYEVSDRWLTGYTDSSGQHWVGTSSASTAIVAPGLGVRGERTKNSSVNAGGSGLVTSTRFMIDVTSQPTRYDLPLDEKLFPSKILGDMTTEFSTCAETVEALPEDSYEKSFEVVSTQKPDFGPDGLACTDDDVHGWIIHSRLTDKSYTENYDPKGSDTGTGTLSIGYRDTRFTPRFKISVPSYATSKDQVTVSSTITPAFTETFGGDPKNHASNNTSVVTVPIKQIQSVIQAKASLNTLEFSGTDIGWTMRFGNTTSG
ncbi:hypothetical protein, partial [Actinomyces vulturis]|uniref:hypothetical protein n=1 Tax=Actinomyces vulturis TaxID=1857645 RepID=UPI00159EC8B2